ncbi:MAG: hypothetical protein WCW27_05320 [Patescibacteria group bacterium]|jgi:dephospho-CoA kinase
MIIALTGEKLAGKGTTAAYLTKQYGATVFRCSQVLGDVLTMLQQPFTRNNLVQLGVALRKLYGDDILAKTLLPKITQATTNYKVIDGLRYNIEYEQFKLLPDFHLVYITAFVETRYQRSQQRTEKADEANMSYEEFVRREQDATECDIINLAKQAEVIIQNNGTFADLYKQIDSLPFLRTTSPCPSDIPLL